jgi:glycosyltransferase involved in cell wall biosynthesis
MQVPEFEYETTFDQSVSENPLVSVIISNYNLERFLEEAIDSALHQTYSNVEVIVVDDGSTDDSRRIIAGYGKRIVAVLKVNGGQTSACNVGFRASKGEIVIFLDADDMLLPATVQRVVAAFQSKLGVAKVQYRLQIVNSSAKRTGEYMPASTSPMPNGDMRHSLIEHGTYTGPATSGNAFAAVVLRRIMPIPENVYRAMRGDGFPDIYLSSLSVMFGQVISLEKPGGLFRVHGGNNYYRTRGSVDIDSYIDQWRSEFLATSDAYIRAKGLLSTMYSVDTSNMKNPYYRDMYRLCQRMISLKLDRRNHPIRETPSALFVQGCLLFVSDSNSWSRRLFCLPWLAAMLLAPRPLSWPLVRALENARWVRKKLIFLLRR